MAHRARAQASYSFSSPVFRNNTGKRMRYARKIQIAFRTTSSRTRLFTFLQVNDRVFTFSGMKLFK